jgi:hypothetical protein
MGIKLKTPQSAIDAMIESRVKAIQSSIIDALKQIGEQCVIVMRNNGNYKDQTGNLRSSTGFMVVSNGQEVIMSRFDVVKDGYEGQKRGRKIVAEVAKKYPDDNVLVVVAGMEYAIYVERRHHKDVITSAQLFAKKEARRILEEMGLSL